MEGHSGKRRQALGLIGKAIYGMEGGMHMILKAAAAAAVCCAVAHGVAEEVSIYPTRGHLVRAFSRMEASTAEKPATIRYRCI